MSTVKSAIYSLTKKIKEKSLFNLRSCKQNISLELRYSLNKQFNDNVAINFMKRKKFKNKKFNFKLFKDYFLLKERQF